MDETDQEMMSEDMDSDNETWAGPMPGPDERMEQCKLGKKTLNLPELFLEKNHIFMSVLSMDTWDNVLSDEHKSYLEKFLPNFPENDSERKRETVKMLLGGEDFKFGNPMKKLQKNLKEGYLHPEIARYKKQTRQFRIRDYKMRQQRRLSDLLKQLLLSRQELFEQAATLAPGEPFKFNYPPPEKKRILHIEEVVKKKTIRILKEVREECGVPDTSSDEDEEEMSSPVQRSRKQLFKSLGPIPSPEPTIPSVVATFASKPQLVNGDAVSTGAADRLNGEDGLGLSPILAPGATHHANAAHMKRPRPISPVEVTEESYKVLLKLHKKKKLLDSDLPELDSNNIILQDILSRCQAKKKNSKTTLKETSETSPATTKKRMKMKAKGEKRGKGKNKEPVVAKDEDTSVASLTPSLSLDTSAIMTGPEETTEVSPMIRTCQSTATNFMCLLRDKLMEFPEMKASTSKLEEQVGDWLELNDEISNPWLALEKNWLELIPSALKFLAGNELGQTMEGFTPFVDLKERIQQWRWIASGRDSDPELTSVFRFWLQHKDDVNIETHEMAQGSPPPPKAKTTFIVRPTSNNEKALFREQERQRFATPHKAFTFMMHGYDSVVGPVKGVYDKDSGTNKAREHNLLISERPPFVTILTLVRDAAARLPNGEGTRGDICELLKDSQFLAPAVTDSQINAVVSGALDRLHSEKDPCVKYDVNRKLWIYLHRNRTEDEFERIHQAQGAAAKAKKTLTRPKGGKASKDSSSTQSASTTSTPPTSINLVKPTFTLSTLSAPSTKTHLANVASIPGPIAGNPLLESSMQPLPHPPPPAPPTSILTKATKAAAAAAKSAKAAAAAAAASSSLTQPTVAQLRAAQAALARSPAISAGGKQTIKQLTSGVTTASTVTNVTSSILTVTSVGLSTTSSLAAQLLYSPRLTGSGKSSLSSSKLAGSSSSSSASAPTCVTTFNLVTTMNPSQASPVVSRPAAVTPVSTISMLQNQKLLKQQQQQQSASQSMLKQNASLVAAVAGQNVTDGGAANSPAVFGVRKHANSANLKQTFSMAAKQLSSSSSQQLSSGNNLIATHHHKNQTSLVNSKVVPAGLKQTSLILSQEAVANLSASQSSLIAQQGGKLVTLNAAGAGPGEGAVLIKQPTAVQVSAARGVRSQALKLPGGNLVQPVMGGKPIQLSGKPLAQAKGLVQLAGKGGQPLGVIRTPHGPISTINLMPQTFTTLPGGGSTGGSGKAATVLAVSSSASSGPQANPAPGSLLTAQVASTAASNVSILQGNSPATGQQGVATVGVSQGKVINQGHTGIVVTQLAQGGLALRSGTPVSGSAKILSGQTNLVPTQFILQQATPVAGSNTQGSAGQNVAGTPLIVSNAGGKGGQNLQVMRTVLSPHGNLKPGQATILISQPTMAQTVASPIVASTTTQMVPQTTSAAKSSTGRGSPKGKGQPVYARIITPPPGLKLANVPVSGSAMTAGGVNVIQTMGKLLAASSSKMAATAGGTGTGSHHHHHHHHQLPVVTLAIPSQAGGATTTIHMAGAGGGGGASKGRDNVSSSGNTIAMLVAGAAGDNNNATTAAGTSLLTSGKKSGENGPS